MSRFHYTVAGVLLLCALVPPADAWSAALLVIAAGNAAVGRMWARPR